MIFEGHTVHFAFADGTPIFEFPLAQSSCRLHTHAAEIAIGAFLFQRFVSCINQPSTLAKIK